MYELNLVKVIAELFVSSQLFLGYDMVSIIQLVLRWISNYSSLAKTDLTLYFVCLFSE